MALNDNQKFALLSAVGDPEIARQISQMLDQAANENIPAGNIVNTPSGNLAAITVQAALNELQGDIDALGASPGANTSLSNLTATAINTHLRPSADLTTDLGSNSPVLRWQNIFVGTINSGSSTLQVTGNGIVSFNGSFLRSIAEPSQSTDATTKNYVDKRTTLFESNPSVGGSASEALTVTGLLTSDFILSVTQRVAGANNTAITSYGSPGIDSLTVGWTANPGAGAVVRVLVRRA